MPQTDGSSSNRQAFYRWIAHTHLRWIEMRFEFIYALKQWIWWESFFSSENKIRNSRCKELYFSIDEKSPLNSGRGHLQLFNFHTIADIANSVK